MTSVTLRASGRAPADLAWERYADPALWPTWSPQIQRVETEVPRLVAGATGTVRAGLLPRPTVGIPFTVLAVDEAARTWAWQVRLGPLPVPRLHLEHGVDATGQGSSTWLVVRGSAPVVAAYAPLAWVALTRLVAP